jgi:probable HAF family extracellular repeat protein
LAIENVGQVVGWSQVDDDVHAFIWQDGVMTDLNVLIPSGSGWILRDASAINDAGEIAGSSY